jgi:hypothetical protein
LPESDKAITGTLHKADISAFAVISLEFPFPSTFADMRKNHDLLLRSFPTLAGRAADVAELQELSVGKLLG